MTGFVKSRTTGVSVGTSRAELNRVLSRYGCTAFGYEQDDETGVTRVTFRVPDSPAKDAKKVPIRLEVRPRDVYCRLYDCTPATARWSPNRMAQAERVAWRHLILWVDAACTAASAGLTTIEEAFFAHRLVADGAGNVGRVYDFMQTLAAGEGGPKLIGAGS